MPIGLNENPVGLIDPAMPLDWSHPLNRGLASRWKVIPNSGWRGGLTFRDLVRGGKKPNDGTLVNGPTWVGGGRRGGYGALSFDGTDDWVDFGNSSQFDITSKLTLSVWIYQASLVDGGIVTKWTTGAGTDNSYLIYAQSDNSTNFSIEQSDNTIKNALTDCVLGQWRHVVATADGSNIQLYSNGQASGSAVAYDGTLKTTTKKVVLGRLRQEDNIYSFSGKIDDVQIYNRGLSAREVAQLYQEQLRGSPETLRWVGAKTYGFSEQAAASGGTPIFSSGILSSRIIGGGGIAA